MEIQINVQGMHCQACVRRVQKSLEKLADARVVEVTVGAVKVDLLGATQSQVEGAIEQAGFSVAR